MRFTSCLLAAITIVIAQRPALALPLPLSLFNTPVTENFDTLASSGTSVALPAGWSLLETGGTGANITYAAGTGSLSTGNTYIFGASGSSERALGTLRSSSLAATVGLLVANQTGATITDLAIAYTGEQWRLGSSGRADRLDFGCSLDATVLGTGNWVEVNELDFNGPVTAGAAGALNGNLPGNKVSVSHQLAGLNLAPGSSLMLRWVDVDVSGSDDGLAIDDFSIMAVRVDAATVDETLPPGVPVLAMAGVVVFATLRRRRS